MKRIYYLMVAMIAASITLSSCSDDKTTTTADKTYGNNAMASCNELVNNLTDANSAISQSTLNSTQETYLRNVLSSLVENVIVPTYTELADDVEKLNESLNGLTTSTLTQDAINSACQSFLKARKQWEQSEAFLGGAASDFDIDPTIDSWPLNRTQLLTYFKDGKYTDEIIEDGSILGFHALEFILFRNGSPRKVAEFQGYDTYKNFTNVAGSEELKYAQAVCKRLLERTYQLQLAWEGVTRSNAYRLQVVQEAGLEYTTGKGKTYGENLINAGDSTISKFSNLKSAVQQILSMTEGSCVGIANEVGTAKIANPFSAGDISYVESPYSYNSITDFQDNIRSIQNVWYGNREGSASSKGYSFHGFFAENKPAVNEKVEKSITSAIEAIGNMPYPFVKYVCDVWGLTFEDN